MLAAEGIENLLVLPADVPLFDTATLEQMRAAHRTAPALTLVAGQRPARLAALAGPPEVLAGAVRVYGNAGL